MEPDFKIAERELSLKRYGQVLGYMQYESNIFWVRSQHFLTAHAFLFGFVLANMPVTSTSITWARIYTLAGASIGGICLAHLWRQALRAGKYWLAHWTDILRKLEPAAYGNILVHREFPPKPNYVGATNVAKRTADLFFILWLLTSFYIVCLGFGKAYHLVPL